MTDAITPETKIRRLREQGLTIREIAKKTGISKSSIGSFLKGDTQLSEKSRRTAAGNLRDVRIPTEKKKIVKKEEPEGAIVVWSPEGDYYKPDPDALNVSYLRRGESLGPNASELWRFEGRLGKPLGSRQEASLREVLKSHGAGERAIREAVYSVDTAKRNDFTDRFAAKRAVKLGTSPRIRKQIVKKAGIQITEKYDLDFFIKTGILRDK